MCNPLVRAWEHWATEYTADTSGALVRCAYQVETPVTGGVVHSINTCASPGWDRRRVSRGTPGFLSGASLEIKDQFGG